jgi:hypothetical protein
VEQTAAPAAVQVLTILALAAFMVYHLLIPYLEARRLRASCLTNAERESEELLRFALQIRWACRIIPVIYGPGLLATWWGQHILNGIWEGSSIPAAIWVFIGLVSIIPMVLAHAWTAALRPNFEAVLGLLAGIEVQPNQTVSTEGEKV